MTPAQFHSRLKKGAPPPATLLLGPEAYERRRIKEAMIAALPPDAITQHDLAEIGLAEVIDDARALSLFANERLIWVTNAELVLPRGKAAAVEDDDGEAGGAGGAGGRAPPPEDPPRPPPGGAWGFEALPLAFRGGDKGNEERR